MAEEPGQKSGDAPGDEDKLRRRRLIGFSIVGAILLVVILLVWVNPSDPTEKKNFIQAVGVLLAALAGLGGLYFTAQNLKQTRENAESQLKQARDSTEMQLKQARDSTEKQLKQARESQERTQALTEQGQITERFTRAIDQLGATDDKGKKMLEIRLGGIYALERIARESEEDHWPIIEVLTAYVRQHAPWRPGEEQGSKAEAATEKKSKEDPSGQSEPTDVPLPDPDIQAILTVLGRRTRSYEKEEPNRLDLHKTTLTSAQLVKANLAGVELWESDLRKANFKESDLRKALLTKADLRRAGFVSADLRGAKLMGANLDGALLVDADLRGAILWNTNLTPTQLESAIGDESTKLDYHKPPANWRVKTDEQTDKG